MSTTDPRNNPPDRPSQPREIPHVGGTGGIADGSKADDHDGIAPPSPEAVRAGYEPDGYDTRSVVSVPVLVVFFFLLAFGTTTALFAYFTSGTPSTPGANPQAAERNKPPLSDRVGRIDIGGEVDRPRLDGVRIRDDGGGDPRRDPRAITRPEVREGNPPYLHPEDIQAGPVRTPELFRAGWGDAGKTFAHVPIDLVMKDPGATKLFPARAAPSDLPKWENTPTAANAGRGANDAVVVVPPLPAGAAPKKDEVAPPKEQPKKDEPKKEEPKKDEAKKDGPEPPKKDEPKKEEKKEPPQPPKGPAPGEGKK